MRLRPWVPGALLLAAAALTLAVRLHGSPWPSELWLVHRVQELPAQPWLDVARWINRVGGPAIQLPLVGGVILALAMARLVAEGAVLLWAELLRLLTEPLKEFVGGARPGFGVRVVEHATGYGFPSGHATAATVLGLALAWVAARHIRSTAWRTLAVGACLLWAVAAGWARVLVGAHWPVDVLGGWLWGAAFVAVALLVVLPLASTRGGRAAGGRAR